MAVTDPVPVLEFRRTRAKIGATANVLLLLAVALTTALSVLSIQVTADLAHW